MKRRLSLFASVLVLAGCATSDVETPGPVPSDPMPSDPVIEADKTELGDTEAAGPVDYDEAWFISGGWPGEYPLGFSVLEAGVVLAGRAHMHPSAAADIACPVEQFATYQQWNNARGLSDDLDFVTATLKLTVTMTADAPIEVPADPMGYETKQLGLKEGDRLIYKRYLGEGYAIIEVNDREYDINENELANVSDIDEVVNSSRLGEDLWVELACADVAGSRAWILYDDAIETAGIGPTPVFGYGDSRDLSPEDVALSYELKQALAEMDAG